MTRVTVFVTVVGMAVLAGGPMALGHPNGSAGFGGPDVTAFGNPEFFPNVKTDPLETSDVINVPLLFKLDAFQEGDSGFIPFPVPGSPGTVTNDTADLNNVVGVRIFLSYDSNELDIDFVSGGNLAGQALGNVTPSSGNDGGLSVTNARQPASAIISPVAPNVMNAQMTLTAWMNPGVVSGSGIDLNFQRSVVFTLASLQLHARHTTLTNGDIDLQIDQIFLINHATGSEDGHGHSLWVPGFGWVEPNSVSASQAVMHTEENIDPALGAAFGALGVEHVPEPVTGLLVLGGVASMIRARRKKQAA